MFESASLRWRRVEVECYCVPTAYDDLSPPHSQPRRRIVDFAGRCGKGRQWKLRWCEGSILLRTETGRDRRRCMHFSFPLPTCMSNSKKIRYNDTSHRPSSDHLHRRGRQEIERIRPPRVSSVRTWLAPSSKCISPTVQGRNSSRTRGVRVFKGLLSNFPVVVVLLLMFIERLAIFRKSRSNMHLAKQPRNR